MEHVSSFLIALLTWRAGAYLVGAAGAQAFAEALRANTTLQTLSLRYERIGDDGAQALADALRENTALQTLELSDNGIGVRVAVTTIVSPCATS